MSDFNYQEYLRNNPLTQEEVKEEQLLTEEKKKDVEESAPGYKHDCAAHVMHESHGYGLCLEGRHTLVETTEGHAEVTHYDVMFKSGEIVEKIPVNELKVITSESHSHSKYEEDDVEEVMGIDRKGNKKPDSGISKKAKAKQDAKNMKEEEIQEGIPQGSEIADYVEGMFNSDVVEKEGFQSDIWRKEQYASNDYREGSVFLDLVDHLKSVGGKDVLEGNPDIHLELLSNDDIQWSADVTLDENLAEDNINENQEVFSDEELDYIGDMMTAMYEKLGLDAGGGETDVKKAIALSDRIEGFFQSLKEEKVTEEVTEEEIQEEVPSSKMKVSELKAKIKEDIISLLQEEEEEEVEVEDEVEVEEPAMDASDAQDGLTQDEKEIQDSLKIAYDNAVAMGDQKLADQIGNSITFFTRTHVVER